MLFRIIFEAQRSLDTVATEIDDWVERAASRQITGHDAENAVEQLVHQFASISVASADEVTLAVDYGRAAVDQIAHMSHIMDLALVEHFENALEDMFNAGLRDAQLDLELGPIVETSRRGDPWALDRLTELCRYGEASYPWLVKAPPIAERILQAAYEMRCVSALVGAVDPRHSASQIANPERRPEQFELALNQLGHIASDPDSERGRDALVSLLELTTFLETAAPAVLRLPLHLLRPEDRHHLMNVLDSRTTILESDPLFARPPLHLLHETRIVRGAVWQAHDAALLT